MPPYSPDPKHARGDTPPPPVPTPPPPPHSAAYGTVGGYGTMDGETAGGFSGKQQPPGGAPTGQPGGRPTGPGGALPLPGFGSGGFQGTVGGAYTVGASGTVGGSYPQAPGTGPLPLPGLPGSGGHGTVGGDFTVGVDQTMGAGAAGSAASHAGLPGFGPPTAPGTLSGGGTMSGGSTQAGSAGSFAGGNPYGASVGDSMTGGDGMTGMGGDLFTVGVGGTEAGGTGGALTGGGAPGASDHTARALGMSAVIAGRYEIRKVLGHGGMGAVYRVFDRDQERDVALKVMLPSLMARKRAVARFNNEARLMLDLTHEGIVRVFDVGRDRERGLRYFTMELLEGCSLREWMTERQEQGQAIELQEALLIVERLLAALRYAHRYTIHRDLKPDNIFLVGGDLRQLKVLDFGIAKIQNDDEFTKTNVALGTFGYMAPEQRTNAAGVDARADLYSVCVILYELLTGVLPMGRFATPTEERRGLPPSVDPLVLTGLEARPERRYETAEHLLRALIAVRDEHAGTTLPPRPATAGASAKRSSRGLMLLLLALVVGGAAFGGWKAGWFAPTDPSRAEPTNGARAQASPGGAGAGGSPVSAASSVAPASLVAGASGAPTAAPATTDSPAPDPSPATATVPPPARVEFGAVSPAEGAFVREPYVEVSGEVDGEAAAVHVNGIQARRDGRTFLLRVAATDELVLTAHDRAGEEIGRKVRTLRVDADPPVLTLHAFAAVTDRETLRLTGVVREKHLVRRIDVGGIAFGLEEDGSFALDVPVAEGLNRLELRVADAAGNEATERVEVIGDRAPPTLTLADPPEVSGAVLAVSGTLADADPNAEVEVTAGGVTQTHHGPGPFEIRIGPLAGGDHEVTITARDTVGHTKSERQSWVVDAEVPRVVLTSPRGRLYTRRPVVKLRGTASDDTELDRVEARVTAADPKAEVRSSPLHVDAAGGFDGTVKLEQPGRSVVEVVAFDLAGNRASETREIVLDKEPPVLRLARWPRSIEVVSTSENKSTLKSIAGVLPIRGAVSDVSPVRVLVNEEPAVVEDGGFRFDLPLNEGASNLVLITASDEAGNVTDTIELRVAFNPARGWVGQPLPRGMETVVVDTAQRYLWRGGGLEAVGIAIPMVYVPEGVFQMGGSDAGRGRHEGPPHQHPMLQGYYLGYGEVTVGEFRAFADATGHRTPAEAEGGSQTAKPLSAWGHVAGASWRDPKFPQQDGFPVVCVTWDDAMAFAAWAGCDLPTEPEWEKAARGPGGNLYPWGKVPPFGVGLPRANFDPEGHLDSQSADGAHRTIGPAIYADFSSPFGTVNQAGNVWEWCKDHWEQTHDRYAKGDFSPPGPNEFGYRAIRGGSWRSPVEELRSTNRKGFEKGYHSAMVGFRVVVRGVPDGK